AAAARPTMTRLTPANTNMYDPLLGRTYAEIGTDARSNHKCQGMSGLPALPGFNSGRGGGAGRGGSGPGGLYQLIDSTIPGQKESDYQDAAVAAHGLSFDAVADDGMVIAGEPVKLSILAVNRGSSDISVTGVTIAGFDGPSGCAPGAIGKDAVYTCAATAHVP